jgi:archaellin
MKGMRARGELGVGMLIITTVLLLIAVMAAIVLINWGSNMQQRDYKASNSVKQRLSTATEMVSLTALRNESDERFIDRMELVIRPMGGSGEIKFNDTGILFETHKRSYHTIGYAGIRSNLSKGYTVEYLQTAASHSDDSLKVGDVAKLTFYLSPPVAELDYVRLQVIYPNGNPLIMNFRMPDVLKYDRVRLFP